MVKRTGPTNNTLKGLIIDLKKASSKNKTAIWKRVATDLERPTRIRRKVNLYKIDKTIRDGEIALIPGKILSIGSLSKKREISAYQVSESALRKIHESGSKFISIKELVEKNPKGNKVRIVGW